MYRTVFTYDSVFVQKLFCYQMKHTRSNTSILTYFSIYTVISGNYLRGIYSITVIKLTCNYVPCIFMYSLEFDSLIKLRLRSQEH